MGSHNQTESCRHSSKGKRSNGEKPERQVSRSHLSVPSMQLVVLLVGLALVSGCSAPADEHPDGWSIGPESDAAEHDAGSDEDSGSDEVVCGEPEDVLLGAEEVKAAGLVGCDIYRGTIHYSGHFDLDLSELSTLRVVEGDLTAVDGYKLESYYGLETLERVGGSLRLGPNWSVDNLAPLSNLRHVGGQLEFREPAGVTDLSDFGALQHIGRLSLSRTSFRTLDGLEDLEGIWEELILLDNEELTDLTALSGLSRVEGKLKIRGNDRLGGLQGLQNIRSVGALLITQNANLQSLDGLAGLERVRGNVQFADNPKLSTEDVQALVDRIQVDGEVYIR